MHCVETEQGKNRKFARTRLFSAGILASGDRRLNCLIRNISSQGAQIRVNARELLPDPSYLINLKSGAAHRAHPIWRKGSLSGLRLSTAYALNALPPHLQHLNPCGTNSA